MEKIEMESDIKKLGFGLMRLPMLQGEIDLELVKEMVDHFMGRGFTYFDTAYVYAGGKSESVAKDAIVDRYPREAFQLATKLPIWMIKSSEDMANCFSQQLERAGVDYFDFYLLHGMRSAWSDRFPSSNISKAVEFDAWSFIRKKKQEGYIKHIGFSFHDTAEVLDQLLEEHPETEFVQLQINYADWEDEIIQAKKCYEIAKKHLKPVVIMEPVKGGTLVNLRPEIARKFQNANPNASLASWAIRFGASLDGIITVLSGMSNMTQMTDNVSYMEKFKPLTDQEHAVITDVVQALKSQNIIGCTGCGYCLESCPKEIKIPNIFDITNHYKMFNNLNDVKHRYLNAIHGGGRASDCVACGACESHCPQKLAVVEHLKTSALIFD